MRTNDFNLDKPDLVYIKQETTGSSTWMHHKYGCDVPGCAWHEQNQNKYEDYYYKQVQDNSKTDNLLERYYQVLNNSIEKTKALELEVYTLSKDGEELAIALDEANEDLAALQEAVRNIWPIIRREWIEKKDKEGYYLYGTQGKMLATQLGKLLGEKVEE